MSCLRWVALAALALTANAHELTAQPEMASGSVRQLSKTVTVRRWGNEQGLPQSSVTRLAVDGDGYVWGATFGGLIRFDGQSIVSLSSRELPVLTDNAVTALMARPDGELWIGTPSGTIARLRDGRLIDTLPRPPMPASSGIGGLLVDRRGTLWLSTDDVMYGYTEGKWGSAPLPFGVLSALALDTAGRVLYHGKDGVFHATPGGGMRLAPPVSPSYGRQLGMHADARGRLWMGSVDGLYRLDAEGLRRVPGVPGPVLAITSDSGISIWIAVDRVLYRYRDPETGDDARAAPATAIADLGAPITSIETTRDGAVVVGTLDGLFVVRTIAANVIESPTGTQDRAASSLLGDRDGRIWVTAGCSAVMLVDRRGTIVDSIASPSAGGCSRSLARDAQGRVWVGGDGAIRRRDSSGEERVWVIPSASRTPSAIRPLLPVGDTLLFGLSDGRIGRIAPDGTVSLPVTWSVPDGQAIESLARGRDGEIWVGQTGRLTRWRGSTREHFGAQMAIPNAVPRALLADPEGGVWIGTYGSGLHYFRPGAPARPVPLPDQTVSALLEDGAGRLWMPGNRGATVVAMANLARWLRDSTALPQARVLSSSAGVPEGNFGMPAATVIAPGVLAFSSVDGVVVVHAPQILNAGQTPPVQIDIVRSLRRTFSPRDSVLEIAPDDRQLLVEFSAPSFRHAEETEFRYRLDGRDADWISLEANRNLRLIGLPPGRFVLRIEARVPDGEWRSTDPLVLEMRPLFVERLWWRVALGGGLVLMLTMYFRQRLRAFKADARASEIAMRARQQAAELQEQHQRELAQVSRVAVAGELTASLSHELGQPLAAMVNNAEAARRLLARVAPGTGVLDPRVGDALQDVVVQGQRASEIVQAFRRFLRREHGERETLAIGELLESTLLLLRREYADADVSLTLAIDPATPTVHGERVLLQQLFVNLLQNALHAASGHRGAAGAVQVRVRPSAGGVRVSVVDNGPGFEASLRSRAFEPFVTSKRGGLGMGLPIARRVVEAHGGHLRVGRLPAHGAVVSVWFPGAVRR